MPPPRPQRAALLAKPLTCPSPVRERLAKSKATAPGQRYIVLKHEVPESVAIELAQLTARAKTDTIVAAPDALRFEQDFIRKYPNGQMLCHVLGYTNNEHAGVDGIERTMNQYLAGNDGFRYIEHDRTGREIVAYRGQERDAVMDSIVLTIDGVANIVEQELDAAVKQYARKRHRGAHASADRRRSRDGDMAKLRSQQAGRCAGVSSPQSRGTDMVEPGSIFKIVTTAAALTERLVRPDTYIFCENGYWGAYRLKDHRGFASLTVHDGLVKSSNIMMAKLGIQLGEQKFYEYVRKFGFGDATGIALPGEIRGMVHPPHRWSKLSITRMPMGHEVGATPLQVTAAMCAIANGGRLMLPQIVDRIVDNEDRVVAEYKPQEVRRVAGREATESVRAMLMDVVGKKGTAQLAAVPGFTVAGKTGTAQKIENGHYTHDTYVVSFLGYLPAEEPAFVGLVMIDEAHTAWRVLRRPVAGPIFPRSARRRRAICIATDCS